VVIRSFDGDVPIEFRGFNISSSIIDRNIKCYGIVKSFCKSILYNLNGFTQVISSTKAIRKLTRKALYRIKKRFQKYRGSD